MKELIIILIPVLLMVIFVIYIVMGIDYMSEHHPDYKGEDFLNDKD